MKQLKATGIMAIVILALSIFAVPSFADSVTLENINVIVSQGQTASFSGIYFGDAMGDVIHWTGPSACATLDPNGCVDDSPFILTATPGNLSSFFDVFVDLSIAPDTYYGQFSLTDGDGNTLATTDFSVTVTQAQVTTPEPGSLFLLGSGLVGAAGALRRKILG